MSTISPNIKMLLQSIMVSKNALVGSVTGSEKIIRSYLDYIISEEPSHETTLSNEINNSIPSILIELAKPDLEVSMPSDNELKNLFLYEEDFSGISFYTTKNAELTFATIARGVDLSSGDQYFNNRYEATCFSEALRSGDETQIKITGDALKANLPNKKIKYCHWIGNKPTDQAIANFEIKNSQYFPSI